MVKKKEKKKTTQPKKIRTQTKQNNNKNKTKQKQKSKRKCKIQIRGEKHLNMHTQKQNKQIQRYVEGQLFFQILFDTHYCYFPEMPIESCFFSRLIKSKLINLLKVKLVQFLHFFFKTNQMFHYKFHL